MVTIAQKKKFQTFSKRWEGRGYEKGDTAQFWIELLGLLGYEVEGTSPFEHHLANGGYIDVWLHDAGVLVEQKALGVDLDKPELRQGQMKTPLEQALHYADDLPLSQQPRWVLTCNFATFRVYDREAFSKSQLAANGFEFSLTELGEHPEYLGFITDSKAAKQEKELQVSIRAGELVGKLYDCLRKGYIDPESEESMHALNVLCVRIVFCLFCEDSDLFEKDAFYRYLLEVPTPYLRDALRKLFRALDTPLDQRDPYDTTVQGFPYVNGGLFREEVQVPNIDEETKRFLLEEMSAAVNWSEISPTIFGGIFEGTLNPVTRRQGGMHYTSPENIHKVIDPLFLDELKSEFTSIQTVANLTPRQKKNRYARLHRRICGLTFFDPACGSGNFLTETYLSLRKLEDALLHELRGGQMGFGLDGDEEAGARVSLSQFYGIEINDFAVTVAETALWISRLKANGETMMLLDMDADDFPLTESAHILHGNALRVDWNNILPAEKCCYVMGNPPFIGQAMQTRKQSDEVSVLFPGVTNAGKLDYVAGWFRIAATYTKETNARCAFVASNSICQGESVAALWKGLFAEGCVIDFAHTTFVWNNEATDKAHVHVIIVGFSMNNHCGHKLLIKDGVEHIASNINGYLKDAPNVFVRNRTKCINATQCIVTQGSQPMENGQLGFTRDERDSFVARYPDTAHLFRPVLGSREFLNDTEYRRYCLWLVGIDPSEYEGNPEIVERISHVRDYRLANKIPRIRKTADVPHLFTQVRQPDTEYLIVPRVSSSRREYIPIGYVSPNVIANDAVVIVSNATMYDFGLLSSQTHNAWMRTVAGRLKSDYRYAPSVYYNFPYPTPTDAQKGTVEKAANCRKGGYGRAGCTQESSR